MRLHIMTLLIYHSPELAFHGFERVVNCLVNGFLRAVVHLGFVGNKLVTARNRNVNSDADWVSFVMRVIWPFDSYIATINVIAKLIEPSRFFQNQLVNGLGFVDSTVGDLYRQLHKLPGV
jgi:hypothetical protein